MNYKFVFYVENFEFRMKNEIRQLNLCASSGKAKCFAIQLDEEVNWKFRYNIIQLINSMDDKLISTNDDKQENETKPYFPLTEKLSKNPVASVPGIESYHAHLTFI